MDMLGPLQKTKSGYQFIVVITYRNSNLTKAISSAIIMAPVVSTIFVDH